MFLLWHPSLTAINLSYTFPILETSATASCGSTCNYGMEGLDWRDHLCLRYSNIYVYQHLHNIYIYMYIHNRHMSWYVIICHYMSLYVIICHQSSSSGSHLDSSQKLANPSGHCAWSCQSSRPGFILRVYWILLEKHQISTEKLLFDVCWKHQLCTWLFGKLWPFNFQAMFVFQRCRHPKDCLAQWPNELDCHPSLPI